MPIVKKQSRLRRSLSKTIPFLGHIKRIVEWQVIAPIRRMSTQHKTRLSGLHVDPYQIYWISPHIINHTIYGPEDVPNPANVSGMIKNGNWDRNTLPVQDLDIVRGAIDRFIKKIDWEKTEYYQNHLDHISKGVQWRGCKNKDDLDIYCSRFDNLFKKIRDNGYQPQSKIKEDAYGNTAPVEHEITVHIDRDGNFLFCDGRHRFAIALALGIKKIPVKVCIRHAKWQTFCNEILSYTKKNDGKVYQPVTHPDLRHIQSAHGEDRFKIISSNLPHGKGKLLDIGANWGYFCHCFEDLGFDCSAVEYDPGNIYFLEKLKTAQNRRFSIIQGSILTYKEKDKFDIILALNIFHHFLKTETDYNAFIGLLKRIDMETMIFEPHLTAEPQMKNAYRNYEPDEFLNFIIKHSCLNHSSLIGTAEDGRSIYKLWK